MGNFDLNFNCKIMSTTYVFKWFCITIGGFIGWFIGEFEPIFPLGIVMILFVLYDAYSAYLLDKRVHKKYPDKVQRRKAKFNSFKFGKVIKKTIPERLALIILAYLAEKYVFLHVDWHLEYVCCAAIIFEQLLSIAENMSSCNDTDSRFWKMLKKILIDKTEKHLEVELDEYKEDKEEEES